jgi:Ca2+-binding RTX toxin-like protein
MLALFKAAYGEDDVHVNDVDLFVGGLAEAPVRLSQMGSTFTWIFQEQLDRLQEGDRFYYFNQLKDAPLLLADIGSQHFSDIVARNTGLEHLHYSIFKVAEQVDLDLSERSLDLSGHPVAADKVVVVVGNALANDIIGTNGDDTIYGEGGNDRLKGGLGLDALHGGAGHDVLEAGGGPQGVFAYGEAGNDVLRGNTGDDNLIGGEGNDDLSGGGSGKDFLSAGPGDDWLVAGVNPDMIDGESGVDTVDFSGATEGLNIDLHIALKPIPGLGGYAQGDVISGVENVVGSDFADMLIGDAGDNLLYGGAEDDLLDGSDGADTMVGGAGDDTFVLDQAGDMLVERSNGGIDTVRVTYGAAYSLGAHVENLTYEGDYGGISGFAAKGNGRANTLTGGDGVDVLNGRGGADTLAGLESDDRLIGGDGSDRFVLAPGFGNDRIEDFDSRPAGDQDFLDISAFEITAEDFTGRVTVADLGADVLVTLDDDPDQTILLAGIENAVTITRQDFLL